MKLRVAALALALAFAGCKDKEVKEDAPKVPSASAQDPPAGPAAGDPPLGGPRPKVSPSIVESRSKK